MVRENTKNLNHLGRAVLLSPPDPQDVASPLTQSRVERETGQSPLWMTYIKLVLIMVSPNPSH